MMTNLLLSVILSLKRLAKFRAFPAVVLVELLTQAMQYVFFVSSQVLIYIK